MQLILAVAGGYGLVFSDSVRGWLVVEVSGAVYDLDCSRSAGEYSRRSRQKVQLQIAYIWERWDVADVNDGS